MMAGVTPPTLTSILNQRDERNRMEMCVHVESVTNSHDHLPFYTRPSEYPRELPPQPPTARLVELCRVVKATVSTPCFSPSTASLVHYHLVASNGCYWQSSFYHVWLRDGRRRWIIHLEVVWLCRDVPGWGSVGDAPLVCVGSWDVPNRECSKGTPIHWDVPD